MRYKNAAWGRTGLDRDRAHVSVIGVVAVRMVQTNVDTEVDLVILWVPPARVNDLICVGRGIHRAVGNPIVYAIVAIVINPIAQAVRPIGSGAGVTNPGLRRRRARRRGGRAILVGDIARVNNNAVVVGIVWSGVIEDGFLGSSARIRRIKKRRDRLLRRVRVFRRGATHAEEESAEQNNCQNTFAACLTNN